MMTLMSAMLLPLFLAMLIGLATGWWIWARYRLDADIQSYADTSYVDSSYHVPDAGPLGDAEPLLGGAAIGTVPKPKPKGVAKRTSTAKPIKPRKPKEPKAAPSLTAIGIPAAIGKADDLLQIKGVGPKLNALLIGLGVNRFDQIAAWTTKEISVVDGHLGSFKGRILRDDWIEQAELLSTGRIATFESRFGKLDSEN
jgi:predicted flap endonuclease-1-like 5' DNA nuclease